MFDQPDSIKKLLRSFLVAEGIKLQTIPLKANDLVKIPGFNAPFDPETYGFLDRRLRIVRNAEFASTAREINSGGTATPAAKLAFDSVSLSKKSNKQASPPLIEDIEPGEIIITDAGNQEDDDFLFLEPKNVDYAEDPESEDELSDQDFVEDPPADIEEFMFGDTANPLSSKIGPWKKKFTLDSRGLQPHKTLYDLCLFGSRTVNEHAAGEVFRMVRMELNLVKELIPTYLSLQFAIEELSLTNPEPKKRFPVLIAIDGYNEYFGDSFFCCPLSKSGSLKSVTMDRTNARYFNRPQENGLVGLYFLSCFLPLVFHYSVF